MKPHELMKSLLSALGVSNAQFSRETGIARSTISSMLAGRTQGTSKHRQALTVWGQKRELVRRGESWWDALHRACMEDAVGRAVGKAVGAGLTTCHVCGAHLDPTWGIDKERSRP